MDAEFLTSPLLQVPGIGHGFFTRRGGVSEGIYESLNGGFGSSDAIERIRENRHRMAQALQVTSEHLLVPYLIHSSQAIGVNQPWLEDERPRCDGLVTATEGLAIGVTGADCGMILFADVTARVIGAAHAGWRGALGGVLEATLEKMEELGAKRSNCLALLGPMIAAKSYEVSADFRAIFEERSRDYLDFFISSRQSDHYMFDLPGFITARLQRAGVATVRDLGRDTYSEPDLFYSYRRKTHLGQSDYGRMVSAIVLTPKHGGNDSLLASHRSL